MSMVTPNELASEGDDDEESGVRDAEPAAFQKTVLPEQPAGGESEHDPVVGSELDGRYRVEAVLGEGGIGRVYRARHLTLERPVAVKVLLETHRKQEQVRGRFEREARTLAALQHPNIVTITDFGDADGLLYLVMELVEGSDVESIIEREGAMPVSRAVAVMSQVLRSLAYAHGRGVVHRDLKPANVLLRALPDGSEHVEVLDFGLAKFVTGEARRTQAKLTVAGTVVGTPAYMAPEQVSGGAVDSRTDVYAAGVMFFELLTGRLPFPYDDAIALLQAHVAEAPPKASEARPLLSPAFDEVIERALAKRPAERYADGAEMLAALEAAVTRSRDLSQSLVTPKVAPTRAPEVATQALAAAKQAPPVVLVGAVIAALLLVLGGVGLIVGLSMGEDEPEAVAVAEPEPEEVPEGVAAPPLRPPSRDPWEDEEVPRILAPLKARIDADRRLGRRHLGTLRHQAGLNVEDARPRLLHGHAYANAGRLTEALDMYRRAYQRDPSARGDPRMLSTIVHMAGTETLHGDATAALSLIYGREAIPRVREEIATEETDGQRRGRLEQTLARLEAL